MIWGRARAIIHLDLDAFYASVEQLRHPELRGTPVIVGGAGAEHSARSVVCAASYEARVYGVRSAMPLSRAIRLCPDAAVLPVDFAAYRRASAQIFGLARQVTPLVEPLSLDEAYLDVTATPGEPADMAASLRERILAVTGLHASFGVATAKTVAKVASDLRKPRGFVVVAPGEEAEFLRPLPLRVLPGLGPATERVLTGLGMRTLGDLAGHPPGLLESRLGKAAALSLHLRSQGIDSSPVTPPAAPKSISREETFERDIDGADPLRDHLRRLCADVGRSLRAAGLSARTVELKLRYADFTTVSRQRSLDAGSDGDAAITAGALALLAAAHQPGQPIRLLGAGVHNLEAASQLDLFNQAAGSRDRLIDSALDSLRQRFGPGALRRGATGREPDRLSYDQADLREPADDAGG
jgi:DNA polymerase-4